MVFNVKVIWKYLRYAHNYCHSPYRIIVFGASGTGKTQFVHQLLGHRIKNYGMTDNIQCHTFVIKGYGRRVKLYDPPGHVAMQGMRKDLSMEVWQEVKVCKTCELQHNSSSFSTMSLSSW